MAWAPFRYAIRRLTISPEAARFMLRIVRSLWNLPSPPVPVKFRWDNSNHQSRSFETSRDLSIRRLIGYWNGALVPSIRQTITWTNDDPVNWRIHASMPLWANVLKRNGQPEQNWLQCQWQHLEIFPECIRIWICFCLSDDFFSKCMSRAHLISNTGIGAIFHV